MMKQPHCKSEFSSDKVEEFKFIPPPEAPVFEPSEEEFKKPLEYINKIRPIAEKYGLCKIRPPPSWQPPFTVDVEKLVFTPRVQRINELEAATRIKLNFLDQIAKFWELQGSSLKIPMVERKGLDLYSLHRIVQDEGGLEIVTKERKWSKIACHMGYPAGKSVGTILKAHYERILYPYDIYTTGKIVDMAKLESELDDRDYKPHCIISRQQVTPPPITTARRSQRFAAQKEQQKPSPFSSFACGQKNIKEEGGGERKIFGPDPMAKYICHICERGDVEESMLLCDGCDDSYHTFCLMPPLSDIPKGDWRCPKCVVEEVNKPVEAFGFEQAAREYSLQQFGEMADQFKSKYFNMPVHLVPTELVEKEFWRIVSSIDEDVTVEYAADLHTMEHGSGFPTKSSLYLLPGDQEYAEASWNLNNLPVLEDSILGYINADISGMKVPWMYVGMCFATFCWHNEDHWSYSINYLHWGEPKTWYGVPGGKAEAFEETMKQAAPELFQSQPDLLHQLVTIMNPNILMEHNVPVYRTDQNAGEFVITFPRSYHAGFNQGYNFAEAVNFAPADWMKMGRECINHYSMLRRVCVFSHDELVCKMALEPDRLSFGIATACYIDMAEMVDCEKKLRKNLLEWGVTKAEREAFELLPDDSRQCDICKTTCFLSGVVCKCTTQIACLRHYSDLCSCPPEKHTLKYRYTLDELPLMVQKLKVKAESFEKWLRKVRDVLDPKTPTVITLEELQELAAEADEQKFPNSIILERLKFSVLEAQKCVTVIQQLDINKIRTRTRNNNECARYKLTMEELDLFVLEIDNLCCIIQEGIGVRELQKLGKEWVEDTTNLLNGNFKDFDIDQAKNLIEDGNNLCIDLPQIVQLKDRLVQYEWYSDVKNFRDYVPETLTLKEIKKLLTEGMKILPHPMIERELAELYELQQKIEDWEQKSEEYLKIGGEMQLPNIRDLLEAATEIGGVLPSYSMIKHAYEKSLEWLENIEALQKNDNYPYFHTLESIVSKGKTIPITLEKLKKMEDHIQVARSWKNKTSRAFLKKNSNLTLLDVLSPRSDAFTSMTKAISRKKQNEVDIEKQFLESTSPAQVAVTFKTAEEKEIADISTLRNLNQQKNPIIDKYCTCNKKFPDIMLHCQLCMDWYHQSCLPKLFSNGNRNKNSDTTSIDNEDDDVAIVGETNTQGTAASQMHIQFSSTRPIDKEIKFLCPSCVRSKRPRLEVILQLLIQLHVIPIRLPEGEALQCLTERAMSWQDKARKILASDEIAGELTKLNHLQRSKNLKSETENENSFNTEGGSSIERYVSHELHNLLSNLDPLYDIQLETESPLISLNPATIDELKLLLMEGDLLEVSVDETQFVWKVLNAAKASLKQTTLNEILNRYRKDILDTGTTKSVKRKTISANNEQKRKQCHMENFLQEIKLNCENNDDMQQLSDNKKENILTLQNKQLAEENVPKNKRIKKTRKIQKLLKGSSVELAEENLSNEANKKKKMMRKLGINMSKKSTNSNKKVQKTEQKSSLEPATKTNRTKRKNKEEITSSDDEDECSYADCLKPGFNNPDNSVDWVQCDGGCNKWFHMVCVGLNANDVKPDDDFYCEVCQSRN